MRSILIDTNVLMLLIIGTWHREGVPRHRRTAIFTVTDFDLLQEQLRRFDRVVTTPGIVTEASNLMGNDFHETIAPTFIGVCTPIVEITHPKAEVMAAEGFPRLGFADASAIGALDAETILLTDDLSLYSQALYEGYDAINFNHLRQLRP
jgi:hypothetical protein